MSYFHAYDEKAAETIVTEICNSYFPLLKDLLKTLTKNTKDVRINKRRYKSPKKILANYRQVASGFIFGSRAKGRFKRGSDVDIALKGAHIDQKVITKISSELNEQTTMPYHFDVLNYKTIQNGELISHIDRVGKEFYKNTPSLKKIKSPMMSKSRSK